MRERERERVVSLPIRPSLSAPPPPPPPPPALSPSLNHACTLVDRIDTAGSEDAAQAVRLALTPIVERHGVLETLEVL